MSKWTQDEVIHCPDKKCNGMLLNHPEHFYFKCSDCKNYWIDKIEWIKLNIR